MAESLTPRLGLIRWSSDLDTFSRTELDQAHAQLEELAVGFLQDTLGNRPAATTAYKGFLFEDTDTNALSWCTGTAWVNVGTTDHGALSGNGDDDHTQYALADGSRGNFASLGLVIALSG